jgi:hypothetical protein
VMGSIPMKRRCRIQGEFARTKNIAVSGIYFR